MARQAKLQLYIKDVKAGDKYGRLTVLEISPFYRIKGKQYPSIAKCRCDCGNIYEIITRRLRDVRSCGCIGIDRVHHKGKTKIYSIWNTIKTRCFCETSRQYKDYGGRGIVMCNGFRYNFLFFENKIGDRPSKKHSIDRIDNNGNYSCGECDECGSHKWKMNIRWADRFVQSSNRRNNIYVVYNKEKICLSELSRRINIKYEVLRVRLKVLNWSIDRAISTPIKQYK